MRRHLIAPVHKGFRDTELMNMAKLRRNHFLKQQIDKKLELHKKVYLYCNRASFGDRGRAR